MTAHEIAGALDGWAMVAEEYGLEEGADAEGMENIDAVLLLYDAANELRRLAKIAGEGTEDD